MTKSLVLHNDKKSQTDPLVFFELNFMSYCLIFRTMRPYLQIVPRMVIQLDLPVLLQCRLPDNASVFLAEIKAIAIALDHIEQSSNTDFIMYSDPLYILQSLHNCNIIFKTSSFG